MKKLVDLLAVVEVQPKGARVEGVVTSRQGAALNRLAEQLAAATGGNPRQGRSRALRVVLEAGFAALDGAES